MPLGRFEMKGPVTSSFSVGGQSVALNQGDDIASRLIGLSPAMVAVRRLILDVADSPVDVLVHGDPSHAAPALGLGVSTSAASTTTLRSRAY